MTNPTTSDINNALRQLESSELPDDHPRRVAQRLVSEWKSNAERDGLPRVNRHDDKGAPSLDVDKVLRRSEPRHA